MSNHHHPEPLRPEPPTARQQREIRRLMDLTGQTCTLPWTKTQASAVIRRLRGQGRDLRTPEDTAPRYGTAVRSDEITGWGSSARWA